MECIGKGKAAAPYEFGVKPLTVTNNRRAPGGLLVPDNPYDGHTPREVVDRAETLTGCPIERAYVDKGVPRSRAHNPHSVFISGQKRGAFGTIKRELRRRSAIEPIIVHLKGEGHLRRCYLKSRAVDARRGHPPNRRPQLPPRPHLGQRTLGPRIAMPIAPLSSQLNPAS